MILIESGIAISFCDMEERTYLRDIEKLIRQRIPLVKDHPDVDDGSETVTDHAQDIALPAK